jgi:hypothetical protein
LVQKEFDVNVTIIDDRPDYIEWWWLIYKVVV